MSDTANTSISSTDAAATEPQPPRPPKSKKYKLTPAQTKDRRDAARKKASDLSIAVDAIWEKQQEATHVVAAEHGVPKVQVELMLGQQGVEGKSSRGATAFNGWASVTMAKLNGGE
jgi:hypothetical protein